MRIWFKAFIVLSSYFGILQSARGQQAGVYLRLRDRTIFTGGIVPIHVIGITTTQFSHPYLAEDEYENNGLQCVTDKQNCCRVGHIQIGEWYFPDGTAVPIRGSAHNFFRNRGHNDSTVNLNRVRSDVISPTGNFCCQVPDSMDRNQTICVNITTVTVTIRSIPPATNIVGENFTLQCSIKGAGDYLTQIKWLHSDGMTIKSNAGTNIHSQLQLQASHNEEYTCQATVGNATFNESYFVYVIVTMAPSSPQNFSAVSAGTTTVLFSWATPLHPRALANYTLTCVSLSEAVDPLTMTSTEAGNYTLGGFRPATMYNCSVVATNSIGNSTPSQSMNVTTFDESSQFHFWLMKIDNCSEWKIADARQKLDNISSVILDNIENRCQCGFVRDRITDQTFQCTDNAPEAVAYFATIHGTASVNSSIIVSYIEQWASTNDAIVTTLYEVLNISIVDPGTTEGECCNEMTAATEVTTPDHELFQNTTQVECCNETTMAKPTASEPFLNATSILVEDNSRTLLIIIGGGTAGGGVVSIIIVMIVVIAVIVKCRRRRRGKIRIHKTELAQEEKELNRYENLCASHVQEGVYVEECDYGEIKGQQGQACGEDDSHQQHHSTTKFNEYEKSMQITQQSDEPEYVNIIKMKPCPNTNQIHDTSHQQSMLPHNNEVVVDKYKTQQLSAPLAEPQMPREFEDTCDIDKEVYDDTQPYQPRGKGQHDQYHSEKKAAVAMGSTVKKIDHNEQEFNDREYTAILQSSATGRATRYQPLLGRDDDYENNLECYNSINESQQLDGSGANEEYEYIVTKPRYCYRPSVK